MLRARDAVASAVSLSLIPSLGLAKTLTPAGIFGESAPFIKIIILALVASALAAIAITIVRMVRSTQTGSSAFISGLRLGGPLLGTFGAAYGLMLSFIGLSNIPDPPAIAIMAPGVAEALFVLCLGLLAGIVAVVGHSALQARGRAAVAA